MISVFQFYRTRNDVPVQNSRLYERPCLPPILEFQGYGKVMVTFQAIRRFAGIPPEHKDVIHQIGGIKSLPSCPVNQGDNCVPAFLQLHQRKIRLQRPFSVTYGFGHVFKTFAKGNPAVEVIHTVIIFYPDNEILVRRKRRKYGTAIYDIREVE